MHAIALLATYNEERFVGQCIESLATHGIETYLIDNDSTDATRDIAEGYRGNGVVGLERFRREGTYAWRRLLARKAELATTLGADWFLHVDADEIRLSPEAGGILIDALAAVDRDGYNAVNFQEHTFVPTLEHPDHDHDGYVETMRWYYPYLPTFPDRLNAWKRQPGPVELVASGGHRVAFPGLRMYPVSFPMRHYMFLSVEHAVRKWVKRSYDPVELSQGWHRMRAALRAEDIRLVSETQLRPYTSDAELDPSDPLEEHPLFAAIGSKGRQ